MGRPLSDHAGEGRLSGMAAADFEAAARPACPIAAFANRNVRDFVDEAFDHETPPAGSFNPQAAQRGQTVFEGQAKCSTCHVPPLFTEPGWSMHKADEIGIDDFQSDRSPDKHYRTTPLRGLFTRQKGGFYHDGRFQGLDAVVDHYNNHLKLNLNAQQKADLIEFLKSL